MVVLLSNRSVAGIVCIFNFFPVNKFILTCVYLWKLPLGNKLPKKNHLAVDESTSNYLVTWD